MLAQPICRWPALPPRDRSLNREAAPDTADIEEIRTGVRWGVIDGVTTNPSLYARIKGQTYDEVLQEICALTPGPVSAEVVADDVDGMLTEGRHFAKAGGQHRGQGRDVGERVRRSSASGRKASRPNCTLIFSANQGLLAAKAGASLLSPFVGRVDDTNEEDDRHPRARGDRQLLRPGRGGARGVDPRPAPHHRLGAGSAHVATLPFKVLQQMVHHPLTDLGIVRFKKRLGGRPGRDGQGLTSPAARFLAFTIAGCRRRLAPSPRPAAPSLLVMPPAGWAATDARTPLSGRASARPSRPPFATGHAPPDARAGTRRATPLDEPPLAGIDVPDRSPAGRAEPFDCSNRSLTPRRTARYAPCVPPARDGTPIPRESRPWRDSSFPAGPLPVPNPPPGVCPTPCRMVPTSARAVIDGRAVDPRPAACR